MVGIIAATAVVGIGSSLLSAGAQKSAAGEATAATERAAALQVEEQRRQFDKLQEVLAPYVGAGEQGLQGQLDFIGLGEEGAEQAAIDRISGGAEFGELVRQGEEAILQNASATGGLRGGNVQSSLAQFRPQILSSLIDKQYNRLGGLSSLGQNAAAGVGNAAIETGQNISGIYGGVGDAQAQQALISGRANAGLYGDIAGAIGTGLGGIKTKPSFDDVAARVRNF